MVWSNLTNKEYDYPDYSNFSNWIISWEDMLQAAAWGIFFTIARDYVQKYFKGVAQRINVKEEDKFAESSWKVVYYTVSWTSCVVLAYTMDVFPNTKNCWEHWPSIPVSPALKVWYLFQLGFYCHSFYAHFVYEVKRSDFWPLLLHHAASIWLTYFAYAAGFHRIGVTVVGCHDINDITFELGKTFVYRHNNLAVNITFGCTMVSWVVTRLIILPFYVIWSIAIESLQFIPRDLFPFYWGFNFCLCFLVFLHAYWFGLMLRMAYRIISGKEKTVVDTREQ